MSGMCGRVCPVCGDDLIYDPDEFFDGENDVWWTWRCIRCGPVEPLPTQFPAEQPCGEAKPA
jgi:hypothetical protein